MVVSVARRALIGVFALLTTALPVAEVGIFGYETWAEDNEQDDIRAQTFQELMALQADINLEAAGVGLMDAGDERSFHAEQIRRATLNWRTAHDEWKQGAYAEMQASIDLGRARLEEPYVEPCVEDFDNGTFCDVVAGDFTAFDPDVWKATIDKHPWLLWSGIGLFVVSIILWSVFLFTRSHDRPQEPPRGPPGPGGPRPPGRPPQQTARRPIQRARR